jgi:hypothetical protein
VLVLEKKPGQKAQVDYYDPHFPNLRKAHEVELQGMSSIKLTAEVLGQYAAVVIATAPLVV